MRACFHAWSLKFDIVSLMMTPFYLLEAEKLEFNSGVNFQSSRREVH